MTRAKELFELLKKYKFKLKVFDFTIAEMIGVLKNYSRTEYMYAEGIKVNSIYSVLKNKGWTAEDTYEFMQKIEEKIWDLGIEIEYTDIKLKTYEPSAERMLNIASYKGGGLFGGSGRSYYHDIAAIEMIEKLRGNYVREIERSKAFFLTSDLKLARFNFSEGGHRNNHTICEVITDRLLTNILFLKNPTTLENIPLKSIISIHSKGVFIDKNIWQRFYLTLCALKKSKKINDKDISMLFYNKHIEKELLEFSEKDEDAVTSEFVLKEIGKVKQTIDEKIEREIDKQKQLFTVRIVEKETERQREIDKIEKIKNKLREEADRKANLLSSMLPIVLLLVLLVSILLGLNLLKVEDLVQVSIKASIIFSLLAILGVKFDFLHMKTLLKQKMLGKFYKGELKKLDIYDAEVEG